MLNEVKEIFIGHRALSDDVDGLRIRRPLVIDACTL